MSTIYERLKEIRHSYHGGMNQADFANLLGIGQSTLAMMEVGKRNITERHIRTISSICGVNEQWLRTGEGSPKAPSLEDLLEEVARQYDLSPLQKEVLQIIMSFPSDVREKLAQAFFAVLDARAAGETNDEGRAADIDRKKAIIDEEMEARKGALTSQVSTNTSGNTAGGRK